jgi:hypothetical protein
MQANMLAKGLAVLVVGACLATSAEARHRRSWQWTELAGLQPALQGFYARLGSSENSG